MTRTSTTTPAHPLTKTVLSLSALALLITGAVLYAGPLNPPAGPVTGTGKTLAEIEPRITINAENTPGDATCRFKITQAGSYYLPGNILGVADAHGIKISLGAAGGHVSIDMRGHTLKGVPGSLDGFAWDLDNDGQATWDLTNDGGFGVVTGWGRWGINLGGSGRIANINVMSPADGCTALTGGGSGTTTIENCKFRSTSGMGLITEVVIPVEIRNTIIEGDGCNTTSLISLGGETTIDGLTVRARNSTFSGSVINVGPSAITGTTYGGNGQVVFCSGVTATSALLISPGPTQIELELYGNYNFSLCTFTTALIKIERDGTQLRNVSVRADAATSAPVGVRVAANNAAIDQGLWYFQGTSVPVAVDVIGSNNVIESIGTKYALGTGIRLTGSSNTVTDCRFSGTGASSFIGVLITAGSTNNLVTKNEFVNVGGGTAVSNLGGSSNGVAPIVTPGNLGAATNPFSNIQH